VDEVNERGDLRIDLFLGAEDVGVVLGERADPHDAVQRPARLVPVTRAELGQPQGEVAIALQPLIEDLDVRGTVHRLDDEGVLLRLGHEHYLAVLLPVPGALPQLAHEYLRRPDLEVAVLAERVSDVVLDDAPERPAPVVPEHAPGPLLLEMKEAEVRPEYAMVALLGLFPRPEVLVELPALEEGGAVDARELIALGVAPPVGAGDAGQLERLDAAGRRHVRAAAEIEEISLPIE
jgi:hypothetical protein